MPHKNIEDRKASDRRRYLAKREFLLAQTKAWHAVRRSEIRTFIDSYLAAHSCVDCGEDDPVVLDFDHVGEKLFGIASSPAKLKPVAAVAAEVAKCEVRCANCHRRKTHLTHGHRDKRNGVFALRVSPDLR